MRGRICLVTGANSGIGRATALSLAHLGARVVLLCRDPDRGTEALDDITRAAGELRGRHDRLHLLVNNAGTYAFERTLTPDGIESVLAVNYLAPFLLTNLLRDACGRSARS